MSPTECRVVVLGREGVAEFEYVKHSWQERGKVTKIQTERAYPTILVHPDDFEQMWILAVDGAGMEVLEVDPDRTHSKLDRIRMINDDLRARRLHIPNGWSQHEWPSIEGERLALREWRREYLGRWVPNDD